MCSCMASTNCFSATLDKIYNTCTEERMLAACVPNPMGFFTIHENKVYEISFLLV